MSNNAIFLHSPIISFRQEYPKNTPLSDDFQPDAYDVICGRGKAVFWHEGNQHFRRCINTHAERYSLAKTKLEKSLIVIEVVDLIRSKSPNGGFVKEIKSASGMCWVEVGDALAREKTGHGLRDAASGKALPSNHRESKASVSIKNNLVKQRSLLACPLGSFSVSPCEHRRDSMLSLLDIASLLSQNDQDDFEPFEIFGDLVECDETGNEQCRFSISGLDSTTLTALEDGLQGLL